MSSCDSHKMNADSGDRWCEITRKISTPIQSVWRESLQHRELEQVMQHMRALEQVPRFGIETPNEIKLAELMSNIDVWGLNIFDVHRCSQSHSLTAVVYTIFKKRELFNKFSISSRKLVNYLVNLESHYLDVPYHNSVHAADVTQAIHVLLLCPNLKNTFTDLEIMAALFSAAIHDVDHPGVSNQYLIDTSNELALMYNDVSVLENHSLAVGFKLLQEDECDFLENLSNEKRKLLRQISIEMVLATDMSVHSKMMKSFTDIPPDTRYDPTGSLIVPNSKDRFTILQKMLHCADLSNPTKPLDIYVQWVDKIMKEFHMQGDRERDEGLEISPMCDRDVVDIEKSQVGFINAIVQPLWQSWSVMVHPHCRPMLDNIVSNRQWYINQIKNRSNQRSKPPPSSDDRTTTETDSKVREELTANRFSHGHTDSNVPMSSQSLSTRRRSQIPENWLVRVNTQTC